MQERGKNPDPKRRKKNHAARHPHCSLLLENTVSTDFVVQIVQCAGMGIGFLVNSISLRNNRRLLTNFVVQNVQCTGMGIKCEAQAPESWQGAYPLYLLLLFYTDNSITI